MSTLFKYMADPYSLLEDGFIRATQLSALNDPFEAIYCKENLNKLAAHFDNCYSDDKEMPLVNYIEEQKHRIGIISFSESKDNLLMWAHYANNHKGVVIGFTELSSALGIDHRMFVSQFKPSNLFSTTWSNVFFNGKLTPVMYRKQARYRVDKLDYDYSNISGEGADRILFEIFQQKSDEWIYEKEHRVILRLEQADKVKIFNIDKLSNKQVLDKIIRSEHCKKENAGSQCFHMINLYKIEPYFLRETFGVELAKLSKNPSNIYLFKLKPSAISCCLLGLKCEYDFSTINHDYAKQGGVFKVFKTKSGEGQYTLYFD